MATELVGMFGIEPDILNRKKKFLIQYAKDILRTDRDLNPWLSQAIRASALHDAAQFAWMENEEEAISLLRDASNAFILSGSTYGYYLSLLFDPPSVSVRRLSEAVYLLDMLFPQDRNRHPEHEADLSNFSIAVGEPIQQTYLIMALSLHQTFASKYRTRLEKYIELLKGHYVHPIGTSGTPISVYINITEQLHKITIQHQSDFLDLNITQFIEQYTQLVERRNVSFDLSRKNNYLWSNAHINLDFIDFDQVGFVTLMKETMPEQFEIIDEKVGHSQYSEINNLVANQLIEHRQRWNRTTRRL